MVRVVYHMQVWETARHLRKSIGKMQAEARSSICAKFSWDFRKFEFSGFSRCVDAAGAVNLNRTH